MDAAGITTVAAVVAIIGIDFFFAMKDKRTISEVIWHATMRTPLIPFLFGMLMGHFFFCPCEFHP